MLYVSMFPSCGKMSIMSSLMSPVDRLVVALDVPSAKEALDLARCLQGRVGVLKVGLELFCAEGPSIVRRIQEYAPVFLDLKLHDIPNTVKRALARALEPDPILTNIHALGGFEMMRAAAEVVQSHRQRGGRTKLLAVTVLTSMDRCALEQLNILGEPIDQVLRLSMLAQSAGCDGVVCSAMESAMLRVNMAPGFLLLTPGIRPKGDKTQDQARVTTPSKAIESGSTWIVVGRPITHAPDPAAAAQAILSEISASRA